MVVGEDHEIFVLPYFIMYFQVLFLAFLRLG